LYHILKQAGWERDMMMPKQDSGSQSVIKAFAILDLVAASGAAGITLSDASKHLSVSKSTAYRYLVTLEDLGAVTRDERDSFHLGLKILELDGAHRRHVRLIQISWPIMKELASLTEETVHLAMPWRGEIMYVAKVDSVRPIGLGASNGTRAPMYCTAAGKSILARDRDGRWLEQALAGGLEARTPTTITSRGDLRRELEQIRERGYAVDDQEYELGVCCVGAPIVDHGSTPIGAISVTGPASRMSEGRRDEMGSWVREAALDISGKMGYTAPLRDLAPEVGWPVTERV
jgi:DNA-binding IclR family transcriptional regulator